MTKRRTVAWLVVLVVGLALIPAAGASASNVSAASKASEKRQNKAIVKVAKAVRTVSNKVAALNTKANGQGTSIDALNTKATDLDTRLKAIEAGVPAVLDGLTKLSAAATALKTGLETAGAGLTKLGDAYGAVEYGAARLYAGTNAVATIVTSDIPDDGNSASANGSLPFQTATGGEVLTVRAAIRSAEADGAATGDPAGQVGGVLYATCMSGGTGCAGGGVPPGAAACTPAGPPPPAPFTTPAGVVNLNLVNIQQKADRTDQAAPSATDTNVATGAGATSCTLPGAGLYNVFVAVTFVDLPTSATPGPKD